MIDIQYNVYKNGKIPLDRVFQDSVALIVCEKMKPEVTALIDKLVQDNCDTIMALGGCSDEIEQFADDKIASAHLITKLPNDILGISTLSFRNETAEDAACVFTNFSSFQNRNVSRDVFIFDNSKKVTELLHFLKLIGEGNY